MSGGRKLKLRAAPRPRRYTPSKRAEPVPLASKFQTLLEQDEQPPSRARVHPPGGPATSVAQRLQDLLQDPPPSSLHPSSHVQAPNLADDEVEEAVDSDDEDEARSSAKVMGPRLDELVEEGGSWFKHGNLKKGQSGRGPIVSTSEARRGPKEEDDIEACDSAGTSDAQSGARLQPLPRIAEQFQEALLAAPSFECIPSPSAQFLISLDYSTRLQRILQLEKQQHAEIIKGVPRNTDSLQVQILKKSLEGRLITCKCQVTQAPSKWEAASSPEQVHVIFNSKVAADLEMDVGCEVRIHPPWRELTPLGSSTRVILNTYFCESVRD